MLTVGEKWHNRRHAYCAPAGWYHNLVTHLDVTIELGTEKFEARATVVDSAEWDRLWSIQLQKLPGLAELQSKITRKIPVVLLERKK